MPPGVTVDEKTVYTSDGALELQSVPEWVAIIGSGYIGLEFSDVYTALGSEVTFIEALPNIMPTFDKEIAKMAERLLIRDRPIDYRTGVFASEVTPGIPGVKPVTIKMIDAKIDLLTQQTLAGFIARNPAAKLTRSDYEFLMSNEANYNSTYLLIQEMENPHLFLVLLRQAFLLFLLPCTGSELCSVLSGY